MKKLLTNFMILIGLSSFGQTLEVSNANLILPQQQLGVSVAANTNSPESTVCGVDTNGYALAKATGLEALSLNNATSATAIAQYFDAPQSLTISGVSFYAWKPDLSGSSASLSVNVEIYAAALDSTPTGLLLASESISIDTTFGQGTLDILRKHVNFSSAITVNSAYVVVLSNPSATSLSLVNNSWSAADGDQEWLSSVLIGTSWLRAYDVNIGGFSFDADCLFEPHVSYTLDADFTIDNPCFATGTTINFTNTSSPVAQNRMYNVAAFQSIPNFSFTWEYGDGSLPENLVNGMHSYTTSGPYAIKLSDTLFGWTSNCYDSQIKMVDLAPVSSWTSSESAFISTFTNTSIPAIGTTFLWDLGDGNTSTLENPVHTYSAAGNYNVCLTVSNSCGIDSSCGYVNITCPTPSTSFTNTNTNLTVAFTNSTSSTGTTNYLWDFGDGNTSTFTDPTHTYANEGSYTVCLIASNGCGSDTSCIAVNVVNCINPTSSFTSTGTGTTFTFSNTSTTIGSATYAWDFGDGNTSTSMDPSHTYLANGSFTVTLIVVDSCGTNTFTQTILVAGVGLDEIIKENLVLYPNPANDLIQLLSDNTIQSVDMYDLTGKRVYSSTPNKTSEEIDTKEFANGSYTVSIQFESGSKLNKRIEILH